MPTEYKCMDVKKFFLLIANLLLSTTWTAAANTLFCGHSAHQKQADTVVFVLRDTFCSSQFIIVGGQIFDPGMPEGKVFLKGTAQNGKDSLIDVKLTYLNPAINDLNATFCEGDTIRINGKAYHANFFIGQEILQGKAKNGCDSIINVNLTFIKRGVNIYRSTICEGDSVKIANQVFNMFRPKGDIVLKKAAKNGCDSLIQVELNVITPPYFVYRDTICPGTLLTINGVKYSLSNRFGLEVLDNASYTGCDSLVSIELYPRAAFVFLGKDTSVVFGDTVCLSVLSSKNPISFTWQPAVPCLDPNCTDTCFVAEKNTTYGIVMVDAYGCTATDQINISVDRTIQFYAPNAFNPDAREPNNRFFVFPDKNRTKIIRRFLIADRWGEPMYDRSNLPPDASDEGWDGYYRGKIAHVDTYIYYVEYELKDGSVEVKKGGFTLIR